ncbi:hypothetical protein VP01_1888g4 [Puccinia sorghi]|uniref:Retrotransposon gag domain-containing protein n=1 Tax=Puccinia sorghi TaxID=27349 RepID=A0A0L6VEW8_9BASI|nr:hypothetical protein VP01_1888g4 [Puccinia sorghi]
MAVSEQRACVDQLATDVTQMGDMMQKMMSFLETSPILNPPPQAAPPPVHTTDQAHEAPPHMQAHAELQQQAPLGIQCISRLEEFPLTMFFFVLEQVAQDCTVKALLSKLVVIFGDKLSKENAKRQLANCQQRGLSIGEYNTQFSSLVYLVEDVEANCIEKYVDSLNSCIIHKAMSKEWLSVTTLEKKMELASEAAAELDIFTALPYVSPSLNPQAPLSLSRPPGLFPPRPPAFVTPDPDTMEVDAATARCGKKNRLSR